MFGSSFFVFPPCTSYWPRDPQRHEGIDHWQLLGVFELHQRLGEVTAIGHGGGEIPRPLGDVNTVTPWNSMGNSQLVGGWATPLKNLKVNWDDDIPNICKNIKWQPNHQPVKLPMDSCQKWCQKWLLLSELRALEIGDVWQVYQITWLCRWLEKELAHASHKWKSWFATSWKVRLSRKHLRIHIGTCWTWIQIHGAWMGKWMINGVFYKSN